MRLAIADPPYAGNSRLYRKHPDYAGEVEMGALTGRLEQDYDGWALCLSVKSLPQIMRMCPDGVLVAAWFKPISPPLGDHFRYNWEPVLVKPLRRYGPGYVPLALIASPEMYTFRETPAEHVIGAKPEAFSHWVFSLLGADPELDELDDLFPGSGAVGRAWKTYRPGPTVSDGYQAAKASRKAAR